MRLFIFLASAVCLASLALFFYLEHDTQKFIKNLPNPRISTTDPESGHTPEKTDTLSVDNAPSVDTQESQAGVDGTQQAHTHPPQADDTQQQEHTHATIDTPETSKPPRRQPAPTQSNTKEAVNKKPPKPLETLKNRLIKTHGDIPLVHTYIELRRKELNREPMTMDEVSTLWEAIMVFNPTPANQKSYELIKRLSSQADPGTFEVIYDPEKLKEVTEGAR